MACSTGIGSARRMAGLLGAPLVFVAVWLAPLPLETPAHRLAAVFAATIVAWVTEVVPSAVTALLIAPAMVLTGIAAPREAFAPYADPLLFLFVGSFFIARAMARHGLDQRIARGLMALPGVRSSARAQMAAVLTAAVVLSMWISNTATTAMLIPIVVGMGSRPKHNPMQSATVLAVAYVCSVGGLGTLVGSPPNAIAARFLRERGFAFGFVDWMRIGLPTSLILAVAVYLYFIGSGRISVGAEGQHSEPRGFSSSGPWTTAERVTALSFGLAVVGWLVPGVLEVAAGDAGRALSRMLPSGAVALLASSVLFVARDRHGDAVLPWSDAVRIDWGVIMLFGGGITLGTQMIDTGLAEVVGRAILSATGVTSVWTLTALLTVFTILFTEVCSNTATSNMIVPLAIASAQSLGVSALPPVLGVALAASCAFMLPIATGPNAIAFGSGHTTLPQMLRAGWVLNGMAAVLIFVILRVLCPLYGWV